MRLLWQFVLDADRQHDLTHPERGKRWAYPRVWPEIVGEDGEPRPDPRFWHNGQVPTLDRRRPFGLSPWAEPMAGLEPWFDAWSRNARAMRSLAARLHGAETRKPGVTPARADGILDDYLQLPVRVAVVRVSRASPAPKREAPRTLPTTPAEFAARMREVEPPLTRENFRSVRHHAEGGGLFHGYWQGVFLSLVDGQNAEPVCGRCEAKLPPTPKGKPSRAKFCKDCIYPARKESDLAGLRKLWVESKKRVRKEEREVLERLRNAGKG